MRNHEEAFLAVRAGEITFARFVHLTSQKWTGLAYDLLSRWRAPVSVEDVRQELLLAAWGSINKWDPDKGVTLERYATWNACDKAKKWLHKQRGANLHGASDKAKSRYALPVSSLVKRGADDETASALLETAANRFAVNPDMTVAIDVLRAVERVLSVVTARERVALQTYLTTLDQDAAATVLYDDPISRRVCKLGSKDAAYGLVRRVVNKVRQEAA